jgi:hypothetical protein
MIERVGLKEESQILIPAIAARMNKTSFPEQCNSFENVLDVII